MKKLVVLLSFACAIGRAATLFISAYPNSILVFDEGKGQVVERITLSTGLPTGMRLSQDRKIIYVITNDHSGVEVIDVATRKVTNHFVLNTADKHYRFYAGTPDPEILELIARYRHERGFTPRTIPAEEIIARIARE